MSEDSLPFVTLHPVVDGSHRWRALVIEQADNATAETTLAELIHWLEHTDLHGALDGLPLVLPPFHRTALENPVLDTLPAGQAILRVIGPGLDEQNVARIDALAARGVRTLLEDTVTNLTLRGVQGQSARCTGDSAPILSLAPGPSGPHLALGVDSPATFAACSGDGWQWLSGNYPLAPQPAGKATGSGRAVMLTLLAQVTADADTSEIEATLKHDPQLSYQLLRLVNSSALNLPKKISSFAQAIALLGRRQLQRWLQLLLFAQRGNGGVSPLMPRAAWRAGLMESLVSHSGAAEKIDAKLKDAAFMVGMFSLLEPLLGQPIADVVSQLNLDPAVVAALLQREGRLGQLYKICETAEACGGTLATRNAAKPLLLELLNAAAIGHEDWMRAQVAAARWAVQISREA